MRKSQVLFALCFFLTVAMVFDAGVVRADVTGSILGGVHDPSGAAIPGVHITVTNIETNLTQETVSAGDGSYKFLVLPVGTYKLVATGSGFEQFTTTGIVLKVNDQLRIDIAMKVGSIQEEVSVAANAVQVETQSTQLGDVIDSKKMLALPLNGRSYIDLLGLQAGVAPGTASTIGTANTNVPGPPDRAVSGNLSAGNVSVNGQRETGNAFLVNGGDVSEGRNLGAGLVPNLDSIEEFRLITNSFDAEYGKFSGAVMNAITKSGTNAIHGDVFEFLRNDKLDAINYFFTSKSELRRNQFGYAVGGPVVIPKVFNGKNKLFWFTDYQGTRQVKGASTGLVSLPTQDQRNGIFNPGDFVDADGNPLLVQSAPCPAGATCGLNWEQDLTSRLKPITGQTVVSGEPYSLAPS